MIKCNLAVLMAERKLSIQDVAHKTGLSRTTISALVNENGKGIQFETMDALCELLKVTPGELFTHSIMRHDIKIDFLEKTQEKVRTQFDTGECRTSEVDIFVEVELDLATHIGRFNAKTKGSFTLCFDYQNRSILVDFDLQFPELRSFIKKHSYSDATYIEKTIHKEFSSFVMGFDESKREGFKILLPPTYIFEMYRG